MIFIPVRDFEFLGDGYYYYTCLKTLVPEIGYLYRNELGEIMLEGHGEWIEVDDSIKDYEDMYIGDMLDMPCITLRMDVDMETQNED